VLGAALPAAGHSDREKQVLQPKHAHSLAIIAEHLSYQRSHDRSVIVQHKSGTVMSRAAVEALNGALRSVSLKQSEYGTALFAGHDVDFSNPAVTEAFTRSQHSVLHIMRNPFETVVSEYAYDHDDQEPEWMDSRLASTTSSSNCTSGVSNPSSPSYWGENSQRFCDALNNVSAAASSGLLPAIGVDETYAGYIGRVDEDSGLLAAAIAMMSITLRALDVTHESFMLRAPERYMRVCESSFDDASYANCTALWGRLLEHGLHYPSEASESLAAAAATSCPNAPDDKHAESSSALKTHSAYTNRTDVLRRVTRMRELDAIHLDGTLARYEQNWGCPLSERYGNATTAAAANATAADANATADATTAAPAREPSIPHNPPAANPASRQRDLAKRQKELTARQRDLAKRQKGLTARQKALAERQKGLTARQKALADDASHSRRRLPF